MDIDMNILIELLVSLGIGTVGGILVYKLLTLPRRK